MHFDSRAIDGATRINCWHEESGEVAHKRKWPLRSLPLILAPIKESQVYIIVYILFHNIYTE